MAWTLRMAETSQTQTIEQISKLRGSRTQRAALEGEGGQARERSSDIQGILADSLLSYAR